MQCFGIFLDLKAVMKKIKGIEPDRDTSILERIQIVRDIFNQLNK